MSNLPAKTGAALGRPEMHIQYIDAQDLRVAEYNPRKMTAKERGDLLASLLEFGFVDPVIRNTYQGRENVLVGGHQRRRLVVEEYQNNGTQFEGVRYEEGRVYLPSTAVHLAPPAEKRLNIRLNKNTGSWDMDILANFFDTDELLDLGFSDRDLDLDFGDDDGTGPSDAGKTGDQELGTETGVYAVQVMCKTEDDQDATFDALKAQGFDVKRVLV